MLKRFETVLLEEAMEFLRKQHSKSKNKILQNIERASQKPIRSCLKSCKEKFGNSEHFMQEFNIGCWHFGIKLIKKTPLF